MNAGTSLMTLCIGASVVTGCTTSRKADKAAAANESRTERPVADAPAAVSPDQQSIDWNSTPLSVASEPVAVKQGSAPLAYLVESPGAFRVHDQTAGLDLARGVAPARTIVRVDGRTGVIFGRETLLEGPLDTDHRYVIFRDPTGPNMARQGTFQVQPHRARGTKPSQPSPSQSSFQDRGGRNSEGGQHVDR